MEVPLHFGGASRRARYWSGCGGSCVNGQGAFGQPGYQVPYHCDCRIPSTGGEEVMHLDTYIYLNDPYRRAIKVRVGPRRGIKISEV